MVLLLSYQHYKYKVFNGYMFQWENPQTKLI